MDHFALVVLLVLKCFTLVYRWIHYTTDENHFFGSLSGVGVKRLERSIKSYRSKWAFQILQVFGKVTDILCVLAFYIHARYTCAKEYRYQHRFSIFCWPTSINHTKKRVTRKFREASCGSIIPLSSDVFVRSTSITTVPN